MKALALLTLAATILSNLVGAGQAISADERAGLIFMREEEKLARDVYRKLESKWGSRPFGNIARAEETHAASVKTLLDRYGLPDPLKEDVPGKFQDKDLQKLYDQLIADGLKSRVEALKVGVLIEELDIADLERWTAKTKATDIKNVYENLTRGSRNHLRSFHQSLKRQGGSYTPKHLSQAAFDKIVNSPMERGGGF